MVFLQQKTVEENAQIKELYVWTYECMCMIWLPVTFEENSTEAKPSLKRVNLLPAKLGMPFPAYL